MYYKTFTAFVASLGMSYGAITIDFNNAFVGGVSAGFANNAGTPTDGLLWGILVDGNGDGLLSCYGQDSSLSAGSIGVLNNDAAVATDDVLFLAASPTQDTTTLLEGTTFLAGGTGGITGIGPVAIPSGVTAGDSFSIIWFDGNNAGLMSDASFVIPADGLSVTYDTPFVGTDPARAASGVKFVPAVVVPEPSSLLLLSVGGLALVARRRK